MHRAETEKRAFLALSSLAYLFKPWNCYTIYIRNPPNTQDNKPCIALSPKMQFVFVLAGCGGGGGRGGSGAICRQRESGL